MPNWCEGNIRLRGEGEKIIEFLRNELKTVGYEAGFAGGVSECDPKFQDDGCEVIMSHEEETNGWVFKSFYVKGTSRNFIDGDTIEVYLDEDDRCEVKTVCIEDIKAAWGFEPGPYIEKANKYGLDIKIIAYEQGMQVKQIVEIVNGELLNYQDIHFADWEWECEMPNKGG